jgi:hypothetical protein
VLCRQTKQYEDANVNVTLARFVRVVVGNQRPFLAGIEDAADVEAFLAMETAFLSRSCACYVCLLLQL